MYPATSWENCLAQPGLLYLDENFLRVILDSIVGRKSHLENSKVLEKALLLLLVRLLYESEQRRESMVIPSDLGWGFQKYLI